MTPCARSHSLPGLHAPGCTCTRECPDHDDHCRGCAPAEATRGLLCARSSQRLRDFLGASEGLEAPGEDPIHGISWAWEHLEHAYPSLSQAPGKGGSSVDDPEAERLAAVLSVRADICDVLAAWVDGVAEPTGLKGPDLMEPHATAISHTRPVSARVRVRRRAAWLLTHIEALEAHEAVAEAWQELADLMSRAHALAPWRSAPTQIKGIPCRCGALALHDHGTEVTCWVCRANYDRQHYRAMTVVFAARFADDPRALREHERGRLESSRAGSGGRP